jgi:hypothetical protein
VYTRRPTRLERQYSYRERFLRSLCQHVAAPTDQWPNVRCWKKSSLNRLFKQVRKEISEPKPIESNADILDWLIQVGLACAIHTDPELFYLLEIGAGSTGEIEPAELMMAYQPTGVTCYFSAISFYSLTSQLPSHHHVAILTGPVQPDPSPDVRNEAALDNHPPPLRPKPVEHRLSPARTRSPFGTSVFSYAGVPYYLTTRMKALVPGVQDRINGPRGRFRITTLEQTLLDTFHKPLSCGGPAVVLEAWHEAIGSRNLDEERLVCYLQQIDHTLTTRRLGALLRRFDYQPGNVLERYLDELKHTFSRAAQRSTISLLPGFDYTDLDPDWLVRLP